MMKRFKQTYKTGLYLGIACVMVLASCTEKDIYNPENGKDAAKEDFFDFSTSNIYKLDVNYGLKNYPVLFEIYEENPLVQANGAYTKATDIQPVYRAATNSSGVYTGEISLPSYVKTAYLYCAYLGTVRCAELAIDGTSISFNQQAYMAEMQTKSGGIVTRGTTADGYVYPEGYMTLGNWTKKGKPSYLSNGDQVSSNFLSRLTHAVVKSETKDKSFVDAHPSPDIEVTQATKLSCVIIDSKADHEITVGYYTYPTGNAPATPADIKNPIIAFPAVAASIGNADFGDEVVLKYWNETTSQFEDEFPAGVSVSFFYMVGAFTKNAGNITISSGKQLEGVNLASAVDYIFYSNAALNQKLAGTGKTDAQRTITMSDGGDLAAICFEADLTGTPFKEGSWDYTDVIMALRFTDKSAANTEDLPKLPEEKETPTADQLTYGASGTLAFEDLWPYKGDYDMNDVVIYYNSTIYKDLNNKVTKIVDEFVAKHDGAKYVNGFGYQFHNIASNVIQNVKIETNSGLSSSFMNGQMLEPGQDHPTIILFDNMQVAAAQQATFTVTTTFVNGGVNETDVLPPYNPFIIAESDKGRTKEVHLTNYPPTTLADRKLLSTGNDFSNPNVGLYYASDNNYPFAICLSTNDYKWPAEMVSIDQVYPAFEGWVLSKGASNASWYK